MDGDAFDLAAAHRELDAMLGRFLAAAAQGEIPQARASIAEFDEALRRHTAQEEERLFPPPPARKLLAPEEETAEARLSRELRLEHVQIRELAGMMRRLLEENGDVEGARRLFPTLARRWDAHTQKEERSFLPAG
jgi:hemerythrin-like domain-containing protein